MPEEQYPTSERVDEVPLLGDWLSKMQGAPSIDGVLPKPHGTRQGVSFGPLAEGFLSSLLTECDHRLCSGEAWVSAPLRTLEQAPGFVLGDKEAPDARLEDLLSALGGAGGGDTPPPAECIEEQVGGHILRASALPTEVARIDPPSFSSYHTAQEGGGTSPLVQFGPSKDHRPDLRQFVEALGTLDPAGIPLGTATLSGNRAEDGVYLPLWRRRSAQIGRSDFLLGGGCKLASLENRARLQQEGGRDLCPLPMPGPRRKMLREGVLAPLAPFQPGFLHETDRKPIGEGFSPPWANCGSIRSPEIGWAGGNSSSSSGVKRWPIENGRPSLGILLGPSRRLRRGLGAPVTAGPSWSTGSKRSSSILA